jgi:hypothetical protein
MERSDWFGVFFRRMLGLVAGLCLLRGGPGLLRGQDGAVPTLHVYANTIQIPVLVLGPSYERVKPIMANRFSVSLDAGPWFRATHVRPEGDDPISLTVLLDESGDARKLLPEMSAAMAGLGGSLNARDRVSLYAMECSQVHRIPDLPADTQQLKVAMDQLLEPWKRRSAEKHGTKCERPGRLWDTLVFIARQQEQVSARRVILAVSDGLDEGSTQPWKVTHSYATSYGVAIFGLRWLRTAEVGYIPRFWGTEDPFQTLCEVSGGVVQWTPADRLENTLREFVTRLRERYIVEFPRPYKTTAGVHSLEVRVDKSGSDIVRPAGISVPLPDAAVLTDPNTVPEDPTKTPEMGNRKVVPQ